MSQDNIGNLGFNVSTRGLVTGQRAMNSFTATGREMEDSIDGNTSSMAESFGNVATIVKATAVAATVFATALTVLVVSTAKENKQMELLAKRSKTTTAEFKSMAFAFESMGESGEKFADITKDINDRVGEFATAGTGVFQDFADVTGKSKEEAVKLAKELGNMSGDDALIRITEEMQAVHATSSQTTFVLESLAGDLSHVSELFDDGSKKLKILRARFDDVNGAMAITGSESENLNNVATSFSLMQSSFSNAATAISATLAPQFDSFFNAVIDIVPQATNTMIDFMNSFKSASSIESTRSLNELIKEQATKIEQTKAALDGYTSAETAYNFTQKEKDRLISNATASLAEHITRQSELKEQLKDLEIEEAKLAKIREGGSFTSDLDMSGKTTVETNKIMTESSSNGDTGLQDYIDEITASTNTGKIDALNQEIGVLRDLLSFDGIDFDIGTEAIENAKKEIESLQDTAGDDSAIMSTSDAINSGLSSLQSMASDGSSAYSALSVAANAFNAVQAVGAVLTQGTGDPYTAFAKMAAMASAVSSLGQSVSFSGGSFDDESADTQASQGTDIYGNDFSSISDSVDITADATEDLVGINTDMLDALTSLESSMTDAAAISADSVTSSSVSTSSLLSSSGIDSSISYAITDAMEIGTLGVLDTLTLGIFDSAIGSISSSIFGGSSSTVDSGIIVDGGTLGDLMSESFVDSYNKVKTDGGWFHSDSYSTYTSDLNDASDQFSLVFESIGDSVYSAGEMLGFSSDYLTDAISSYVVDSLTISLKDLDDDEASEEIEAIFSDVFNDLAESVIPYVSDYQAAGEELGTTLTRLATETSLLNYSADTLGFSLGSLTDNSESLVAAADAMSEYFGGTDSFSDYISTFISEFASDATMLSLYGDTLTESLNDVGLSLPSTSDAMWDLMSSLDASTESGAEQIETLLELSSTASEYYDILDDTQDEMADLSDTFASAVLDIYDLSDSVTQVSLDSALAAAKLGDFSLAEMLDTDDYVLDEDDFSSATDYNVAQAVAANKMLELSELSSLESGDVETQQLDELRAINASIIASSELLTTQTRILTDSVDYLDRINNNTGE